jgi:serine/threonine protein kinase
MLWKTSGKRLQTIGDYEILEEIAGGASGCVYKGRYLTTGELVAIKVASSQTAGNPVLRKRFEQEFQVMRGLDHPNLVRALHLGHEGHTLYLVLEFVDGPTLGDRIEREGPLPEDEAVRILTEVASGLAEAHRRRVIHRDIKPDNILLAPDGQARLTDLGLAKDVQAGGDLTRPSAGLGTPNFMAPEQFSNAKHADARCDIYGLGATLYMAVTGRLPFQARLPYEIRQKKLNNDLTPPRQLAPGLSECVERVIYRSVHIDPRQRHPSCLEFINELKGGGPRPTASEGNPAAPARRRKGEQRATVRYPSDQVGFCNAVGGGKKPQWPAKVQNISAGGLALLVGRRFEPHSTLCVELGGSGQAPCYYLVRVVRVQPRPGRKWLVGCAFARPLSDEEVESLR